MNRIFDLIRTERKRQDDKWGIQRQHDMIWLAILVEEVGEVAQAILKKESKERIKTELVEVAAVAVAWLENIIEDPENISQDWNAG